MCQRKRMQKNIFEIIFSYHTSVQNEKKRTCREYENVFPNPKLVPI